MSDTSIVLHGLGTSTEVTLLGTRVDELSDVVRAAWSRCLAPEGIGGHASDPLSAVLLSEGEHVADAPYAGTPIHGHDTGALLQTMTQQVTYAKISAQAGRLLMLHAGAVAAPSGAAVGFVARGGTGKTTLVRRLANRYGYLTDETVAVDAAGRLYPYPKPLSIRTTADSLTKRETSPDELRLAAAPAEPRLTRLVLLARSDDHEGPVRIEELSAFAAIAAMTPETSSLGRLPRPLHWFSDLLGQMDPPVRVHYREVDTLLETIAGWLEGS